MAKTKAILDIYILFKKPKFGGGQLKLGFDTTFSYFI